MAVDLASSILKTEDVPPPPRVVPFSLWCDLVGGKVALVGSTIFAFGMVFALVFVPATDPVGTFRLALRSQEAQGWLEGVEKTHFSEGGGEHDDGTPIYRNDYTFQLPDGTPRRGSSYTVGNYLHQPAPRGQLVPPRVAVTVEYDPGDPGLNRIKNTRTSPYPPLVGLVPLIPTIAFLVALGGLRDGWHRARLLREGQAGPAIVTACHYGIGEDATYLPVAEYKRKVAGTPRLPVYHPLLWFAGGFLHLWTGMAIVFLVFGSIFCVAGLVMILFVMPMPPRERALFGLAFGGFLVLWVTASGFMARLGLKACRSIR